MQDSVPRPRDRAIVPQQARSRFMPQWPKQLSSSNELDARHVSPHQRTIKRKETTPESHVPACSSCHGVLSVFAKAAAKTEVSEVRRSCTQ